MPFSRWIEAYVEATDGTVRSSTLKEIRDTLRALDKAAAPKAATRVNHQTVKRFIQVRLKSGVRRSTVWKQISSLRRVWYDADVKPNPWAQPKLRRQLKSVPKDWHWYNNEEYHRMVGMCEQWQKREDEAGRDGRKWLRFKGMITVAYTAGLRVGEICHLTWGDVDLDAREIVVSPQASSDTTLAWEPKDHERRIAPLTQPAYDILKQLLDEGANENPYIFVSAKRHEYILRVVATGRWPPRRPLVNNIRRDFRALCKAAKAPLCTFHSLRKSCCTNLLEGGGVPHAIRKIMGHASIETTIKYYSKVRRDQIALARDVAESYSTRTTPSQSCNVGSTRSA